MKKIKLTQGKFALVDDEDFQYLNQWKWQAHFDGYNWYACRTIYNPKKRIIMHRVIMNLLNGLQIDHIDHNGLNNCKNNLRICNGSENQINAVRKRGVSGYIGVTILSKGTRKGRIVAQICLNKKKIHLGVFINVIDAAKAYDKAAKLYHKEYAKQNIY